MTAEWSAPGYDMHALTPDTRDNRGPDQDTATVVGRHGRICGSLTVHVVGVTSRGTIQRQLHDMIAQMPRPDGDPPLCGVEHVEDLGIWETPHSGREQMKREITRLRNRYRKPIVLVHGYQHVGPCPDGKAAR